MSQIIYGTQRLKNKNSPSNVVVDQLYENHAQDSRITGPQATSPTVATKWGTGGNNTRLVASFNGWRSSSGSLEYATDRAPCIQETAPPYVASFMAGQGAKAGSIAYSENIAPTLKGCESGTNQAPSVVIPIHDKATRHKGGSGRDDGSANGLCVGADGDPSPTLTAGDRHAVACWPETARTLAARHDSSPCIDRGQNIVMSYQKVTGTLSPGAHPGSYNGQDTYNDMLVAFLGFKSLGAYEPAETAKTLLSCDDVTTGDLVIGIDSEQNALHEKIGTLRAHASGGAEQNVYVGHVVRRLTPLECERLMGFPDGWTELGVFDLPISPQKLERDLMNGTLRTGRTEDELLTTISDSARYKALGNSVAIPCVLYVLEGIRLFAA